MVVILAKVSHFFSISLACVKCATFLSSYKQYNPNSVKTDEIISQTRTTKKETPTAHLSPLEFNLQICYFSLNRGKVPQNLYQVITLFTSTTGQVLKLFLHHKKLFNFSEIQSMKLPHYKLTK